MYKTMTIRQITFFIFFIGLMYSCHEELYHSKPKYSEEDLAALSDAKNWYNSNLKDTLCFEPGTGPEMLVIPNWNFFSVHQDKEYRTVETLLKSKYLFGFCHPECLEKYEETKKPKYKQSLTRLVIRTNLETLQKDAFFMTISPDLKYLEKSNFKPFPQIYYLERDKEFSGHIIYHDIEGRYTNAWVYRDGKPYKLCRVDENSQKPD